MQTALHCRDPATDSSSSRLSDDRSPTRSASEKAQPCRAYRKALAGDPLSDSQVRHSAKAEAVFQRSCQQPSERTPGRLEAQVAEATIPQAASSYPSILKACARLKVRAPDPARRLRGLPENGLSTPAPAPTMGLCRAVSRPSVSPPLRNGKARIP